MPKTDDVFTYARTYRQVEVAEHEVLLSFNNDDDAYDFQNWMDSAGASLFLDYLGIAKAEDDG